MDPNRGCHSKRRYSTEMVALAKARRIMAIRRVALRTYLCPLCLAWHLTKAGLVQPAR
jgi:hypothetical protein